MSKKSFEKINTPKLTIMTEPTSRRNTMANHHVRSSNAPSKVNLAAARCSKTREAGNDIDNNPARLSRRNFFSAAAAGKLGVGQTLLRVTGLVPQELGLSTAVIVRHTSPISRDWRTTITGTTVARRVDLVTKKWRDDWAVRRASGILDDQRKYGWKLTNQMMMTDDNTYSRSRPRAS